jgi:hypothetical protein
MAEKEKLRGWEIGFKELYKEPLIPNLNYVSSTAVKKGFSRLGDHHLLFETRSLCFLGQFEAGRPLEPSQSLPFS